MIWQRPVSTTQRIPSKFIQKLWRENKTDSRYLNVLWKRIVLAINHFPHQHYRNQLNGNNTRLSWVHYVHRADKKIANRLLDTPMHPNYLHLRRFKQRLSGKRYIKQHFQLTPAWCDVWDCTWSIPVWTNVYISDERREKGKQNQQLRLCA